MSTGAGGHRVETAELRGCSELLAQQARRFGEIERHATEKGGDTTGYTGLLELLAPVVTGVVGCRATRSSRTRRRS